RQKRWKEVKKYLQVDHVGVREAVRKIPPPVFAKWVERGGREFEEVFEREWNRREREMMDMFRKEIQSSTHLPARREGSLDVLPPRGLWDPEPGSGDALCESGSSEGAVSSTQEERSFQQEAVSQTQTPERVEGEDVLPKNKMQQVFEKWIKEGGTQWKEVFEQEWNRREKMIMDMVRKTIQYHNPLPARRQSSKDYPPHMGGDTHSEPDTNDVAQACVKMYEFLREKHCGNSAQVSGYETSLEVSATETSKHIRPPRKRRRSKSLSPLSNLYREEELLDKLGLDFLKRKDSKRQIPGVPPPANFKKVFERECSRRESIMMLKKTKEHNLFTGKRGSEEAPPPVRSGDALCESGSSEGAVSSTQEERSFQQEAVSQTQTPEGVEGGEDVFHENKMQQVFEKWIKEGGTTFKEVFEREWNRREREMMDMFRKEIQSSTPLPARREGSLDALPPNVGGDTHSEPDTYDVAQACVKVYDWLREKHPGNSAQVSGHETSPAV
ncbi:hypothetical protein JZ751_006359, partial [Albula glossodonta]